MSNFQEGQGALGQSGHPQSAPQGSVPPDGPPTHQQGTGSAYPDQGGYPPQATAQFPPSTSGQWSGDQSRRHGPHSGLGGLSVKNSLKSTEFWVFVVVSIALLIAAAASDGNDGAGFGAESAWRYVTVLAVAYIVSRGLAKFSGRDDDDHRH